MKIRKIIILTPYICFLLITTKIGVEFEYSPIPSLFASFLLIIYLKYNPKQSIVEWIFIVMGMLSLISGFILNNQVNGIKEAFFFVTIYAGFIYLKNSPTQEIKSAVRIILNIYLLVAFIELIIPELSEVKSLILTRSTSSTDSRGVSSISTEPSFFALTLFSLWVIQFSLIEFKNVDLYFTFKIIIGLILTKSSMLVIVAPLIIYFLSNKHAIVVLLIGGTSLVASLFYFEISGRFIELVKILYENSFDLAKLDESAGARLFYIIKDIKISSALYWAPTFNSSYEFINSANLVVPFIGVDTIYESEMSGSLLGRFMVEFGFILYIIIFSLYIRLVNKTSLLNALILVFFMILIYLQMISLVFSPISFSLGCFLFALYKKKGAQGKSGIVSGNYSM